VRRVCIVADRGMISQETIEALEQSERGWLYFYSGRSLTFLCLAIQVLVWER
jgi:hypothetical protein